ncbi:MAG: hypothetical protein GY795_10270 [Desulfobacterales bacterium]|nr:hypothetical protein [Desulfobacterales bacterium]
MPIDIAALATTTVTQFLMPYAKAGLDKIAKSVAELVSPEAAEYAGELTTKVWDTVTGAFSSPKEQSTLELFQDDPDEMQGMLTKKLLEKLDQEGGLAQTLSDLINEPGPDGASTGVQIMNAGIAGVVDLRGADLSHAQGTVVTGVNVGDKPTSSGS